MCRVSKTFFHRFVKKYTHILYILFALHVISTIVIKCKNIWPCTPLSNLYGKISFEFDTSGFLSNAWTYDPFLFFVILKPVYGVLQVRLLFNCCCLLSYTYSGWRLHGVRCNNFPEFDLMSVPVCHFVACLVYCKVLLWWCMCSRCDHSCCIV